MADSSTFINALAPDEVAVCTSVMDRCGVHIKADGYAPDGRRAIIFCRKRCASDGNFAPALQPVSQAFVREDEARKWLEWLDSAVKRAGGRV
ncbi:MAG: hypothetical protein JRI80_00165 [Deltaproteobacteria bacterium]|nr:hypothetical protein [Deltaproteobacteria bacterium]